LTSLTKLSASFFLLGAALLAQQPPLPIRAVIVAMFEPGADTGDQPGEFQFWVEREQLTESLTFPQGFRDLRLNRKTGVLGIVTGVGNIRSAASIMALGLDPRFDLSKAYWIIAGIAGIDPNDASLGSAVWADCAVEADLSHKIDPRETPANWPTGILPLRALEPYPTPRTTSDQMVFCLHPPLVQWAYQLTRNIPLPESDAMRQRRALYAGTRAADEPPRVLIGATLSGSAYWHGHLLNRWANEWVRYHAGPSVNYVTTAMEDTGTLQSLTWLARAQRADLQRVLVLRTASNYDSPPLTQSSLESFRAMKSGGVYSAYLESLEAAYRVASHVLHELLKRPN
jgi:purine nucleoside permease